MRVYLPGTWTILRELSETGSYGPSPLTGFAVTPALREWYSDGDDEELEYAAMAAAATASLRLLDADPQAPRRRVVIVADVPDAGLQIRDDLDRAVVRIQDPVPISRVGAVHVDDQDAQPAIAAAAAAVMAADLGDEGAQSAVDDADGFELSWYATQEIAALLELG